MKREDIQALARKRAGQLTDWQLRRAYGLLHNLEQTEAFWRSHVDFRDFPEGLGRAARLARAQEHVRAAIEELRQATSPGCMSRVQQMLDCGF